MSFSSATGITVFVPATNVASGATVQWQGAVLATTFVSSTQLTATVPASDLTPVWPVMVTVNNPNTAAANALTFNVTATVAAPTSLSPSSITAGSAGFTLTITGTGFLPGATIDWNGIALATTFVSATQVSATVPASLITTAGTVMVTVVNAGASASTPLTFTITAPTTLTAIAVSAAPGGGSHILWSRSGGAAIVWTLNAAGAETAIGPTYGPCPGWTAKAIATATDGTSRVLWTNVNGIAGVWSFNAADAETVIGKTYGPYPGWSAVSLATDPSGNSRVLRDNTNGTAGVWTFNASDVNTPLSAPPTAPTQAGRRGKSARRATARRGFCGQARTARPEFGRSAPPASQRSSARPMGHTRGIRRRGWARHRMARPAFCGTTSAARQACGVSGRTMSRA